MTRSKIMFVPRGKELQELSGRIDMDSLEVLYGGKNDFAFDAGAYFSRG
jgi:hypothetical protein